MKALIFRSLLWTHRYLGIALGWLMLIWCLSGLVMMYKPYPVLATSTRLNALSAIDQRQCCTFTQIAFDDAARIRGFDLEMLGGRLLLHAARDFGPTSIIELRSGDAPSEFDTATAVKVAERFAQAGNITAGELQAQLLDRDQWTVSGDFNDDRPLYKVALNDVDGNETYISSVSGRLVQHTTRMQRFWNWLGAVPHWLYLTTLRQNVKLWNDVVVWSSLCGVFLCGFGLWLGVWQLRRKAGSWSSPYRGVKWWHHVPGLMFGVLVLTWVLSGFLSMNPWGWLETHDAGLDVARLQGEPPTWSAARNMLQALPQAKLPPDTVHIESTVLSNQLFAIATTRSGQRIRFDSTWKHAVLGDVEIAAAAQALTGERNAKNWMLLAGEDEYYYSVGGDTVTMPVIRVTAGGARAARYYLDPISGALLRKIDSGARSYRWLHSGLHRLDFSSAMRKRPLRDVLMWSLLLGAATVCATGVYMGIKSLSKRPTSNHTALPRNLGEALRAVDR